MNRLLSYLTGPQASIAVIWVSMLFFAAQACYYAVTYIFGPLDGIDALFRAKYSANIVLVRTHAVGSIMALSLGLFAFLRGKVHPVVGRLYALGVLVGGITSLPMALMAEGGWSNRLAFFLQGLLWIVTLLIAVYEARRRHFRRHRRFMIRNYALTYSAVISRLLLNGLQERGLTFQEVYPVVAWTWVMGWAVAEWWIWYSKVKRLS